MLLLDKFLQPMQLKVPYPLSPVCKFFSDILESASKMALALPFKAMIQLFVGRKLRKDLLTPGQIEKPKGTL